MKTLTNQKPSQYIQGYVEFFKLRFKVTPDVLIPRPETELLVEAVLTSLRNHEVAKQSITVLDLGTGSGNIAISIAKNLPPTQTVKIIATDVSAKALKVAAQNAKLHGVEDQITFVHSNLLNVIARNKSDEAIFRTRLPRLFGARNDELVIVTNLPYIPSARIPYLDSSVKDFEPHVALDGGEDGFELYRKLFFQISTIQPTRNASASVAGGPRRLKPKLLIGEIDYTHGELAVNEALKYFPNASVEVKTDLAHKQRILKIQF